MIEYSLIQSRNDTPLMTAIIELPKRIMKKAKINQSPMFVTSFVLFIVICQKNQENIVTTNKKAEITSRIETPSPLFLKKINRLNVTV